MTSTGTHITERRELEFKGVEWRVSVFDGGRRYMLIATTDNGSLHFDAHFNAGEWAEFQKLVSP